MIFVSSQNVEAHRAYVEIGRTSLKICNGGVRCNQEEVG